MLKYFLLSICIISNTTLAKDFDIHAHGSFGLQSKMVENSKTAAKFDQDWEKEQAHIGYANIDVKLEVFNHKIDANWFVRQSQSPLNKDNKDYIAPIYFNFPQRVVRRDVFKLSHTDESGQNRLESTPNQFVYSWGDDETRFTIGRMFIEFGEGYFFNPIDPFMLPSSLSTMQGIQQGNDGLAFHFDERSDFRLHLYILGDKQFYGYDERIARTLFLHGDWDYSKSTHINYIIGEDQKRHKYGFEISHKVDELKLYSSLVRHSQRLDKQNAGDDGLFHYNAGVHKQFTSLYAARVEFGRNQQDTKYPEPEHLRDFLPFESYLGFANIFNFNARNILEIQGLSDVNTKMLYAQSSFTHKLKRFFELKAFAQGVVSRSSKDNDFQGRTIPREFGLAFQSQF